MATTAETVQTGQAALRQEAVGGYLVDKVESSLDGLFTRTADAIAERSENSELFNRLTRPTIDRTIRREIEERIPLVIALAVVLAVIGFATGRVSA